MNRKERPGPGDGPGRLGKKMPVERKSVTMCYRLLKVRVPKCGPESPTGTPGPTLATRSERAKGGRTPRVGKTGRRRLPVIEKRPTLKELRLRAGKDRRTQKPVPTRNRYFVRPCVNSGSAAASRGPFYGEQPHEIVGPEDRSPVDPYLGSHRKRLCLKCVLEQALVGKNRASCGACRQEVGDSHDSRAVLAEHRTWWQVLGLDERQDPGGAPTQA
jgi:hypothetical protein